MKNSFVFSLILLLVSSFTHAQDVTNKTAVADSNKVKWEAALVQEEELKKKEDTIVNVTWADRIVKYSSEYDKINHSAQQVLGKPNVMPTGGDAKTAWCVKEKKGIEAEGDAFIIVGYSKPQIIQQVVVAENYNPGAIKTISIISDDGTEETIYQSTPQAIGKPSRILSVFLNQPSAFYVSQVKVVLEPNAVDGQNQIDAIGISDSKDSVKVYINTIPKLKFHSEPESLGDGINSVYDEVAPMISPDGKRVYFDRKFHPDNVGTHKDEDDIWYSDLSKDKVWQKAVNIGQPLNNQYNNFVQSITPDGNALLLGNIYKESGDMYPGVSLTYRTRTGWAFPEKQNIADFYNNSPYASYFLSNDGRFLLMSIERKDGKGELDLYVSFRKDDNQWEAPINLGSVVNTIANDYSPFLAADGVTLYFSSEGHPGYGKADIFMTTRLDDTWQNWTEPQNLGNVVNSSETDSKYNIPASGNYAYFSSTNNSKGKNDIFKIELPKIAQPKPVVLISGVVRNNKTNEPIDARIIVEELPDGKEVAIARTDPKTGEFKIILPAGKKYGFRAIGLGFFEINKNIDLTNIDEYTEIEDELMTLSPIEVGQVVRLNNIFFETGKATLKKESFLELDRTISFLNNNPDLVIEISGHTDDVGSESFNQKLSQARAQSVADYLIQHGIASSRLKVVGYGELQPISFNNDEEGRKNNRRVEFKVLKN
ncbi:MAG: OmpA family protein [Bacteroidales bacterium]|nr:OmpA family protein [Bacteroidales bacterium]